MEKIKYYKKIFLTPGIASYKDKGDGVLLIQKETIDKALDTLKGKDVVISHESTTPVGKVVDAYYDPKEGAFICGMNIWDFTAQDLLDTHNYSISCYYNILTEKEGGVWHNIPYDSEAKTIEFVNIAIVKNPRYQEAKKIVNSITNNNGEEMSVFTKIKNSLKLTVDGKEIDLIKAVKNADAEKDDVKKEKKEEKVEDKKEEIQNTKEELPNSFHTKDLNDIYSILEKIATKLGCFEEAQNEEEELEEEEFEDEDIENGCGAKNEEEVEDIEEVEDVEEEPQEESKFEKYKKEKKIKKPIANAIKKSILNSTDEEMFKSRKERIKDSNKKFYCD